MNFKADQFPEKEKSPEDALENPIKKAVDSIFQEHPELESIGTREQYIEYLESIFPDSKFKDIVYHNSNAEFKNDGFKPMTPNFDTLNSVEGVYNFSSNSDFIQRYGKNKYSVLLNIQHPLDVLSSGEYVDDMDRPLSEALYRIGKQKTKNVLAPAYDESLKDTDAVINTISGEGYVGKHPISGRELGIPRQKIISVFDRNQIHILGSDTDAQKFRNFVKKT